MACYGTLLARLIISLQRSLKPKGFNRAELLRETPPCCWPRPPRPLTPSLPSPFRHKKHQSVLKLGYNLRDVGIWYHDSLKSKTSSVLASTASPRTNPNPEERMPGVGPRPLFSSLCGTYPGVASNHPRGAPKPLSPIASPKDRAHPITPP